jgi:hypothetical protein
MGKARYCAATLAGSETIALHPKALRWAKPGRRRSHSPSPKIRVKISELYREAIVESLSYCP